MKLLSQVYTPCPLNDYELQVLREVVDPLQECDDYGVELYLIAREFVYEAVRTFQ